MKLFNTYEIREALEYTAHGGQALHLHKIIVNKRKAPKCFKAAINRGEFIAHLFDQDITRLLDTARRFGVNVLVVERQGTAGQHIDLCGGPLRKAINKCKMAD